MVQVYTASTMGTSGQSTRELRAQLFMEMKFAGISHEHESNKFDVCRTKKPGGSVKASVLKHL